MRSTAASQVARAVEIHPEQVLALDSLMRSFIEQTTRTLVLDSGLDPNQYRTAQDIRANDNHEFQMAHMGLYPALENIAGYDWTATLSSGKFYGVQVPKRCLRFPMLEIGA